MNSHEVHRPFSVTEAALGRRNVPAISSADSGRGCEFSVEEGFSSVTRGGSAARNSKPVGTASEISEDIIPREAV